MVVILAKRLSSVGKEKVESKNFCLYYRQILQKIQTYSHPIFPFSLLPATVHKSSRERRGLLTLIHFKTLPAHPSQTHKRLGRLAERAF